MLILVRFNEYTYEITDKKNRKYDAVFGKSAGIQSTEQKDLHQKKKTVAFGRLVT